MKHITCIGGGHGLSNLLAGLVKEPDFEVAAIVNMMDSGGSTGEIRKKFNIGAVGDLRRAIGAMAGNKGIADLFDKRISIKEISNIKYQMSNKISNVKMQEIQNQLGDSQIKHPIGNILLLAAILENGMEEGAKKIADLLEIRGKVLPITYDNVNLVAKLEDGRQIIGEANIDTASKKLEINNLYLKPDAELNKEAGKILRESDIIIIGPGDLFTSILCNFKISKLREAVMKSQAKKIWINNLTNKLSETGGFTMSDHLNQADKYIGTGVIDYFLYQTKAIGKDSIKFDKKNIICKEKMIGENFAKKKSESWIHNSKKIVKMLGELIANS